MIVLSGMYRFAVEDRIIDLSAGASIAISKSMPHSWRNLAGECSRLLFVLTQPTKVVEGLIAEPKEL